MNRSPMPLAAVLLAAALSCATTTPVAQTPLDWGEADEAWSIHVVTVDPDGDERVTRIWMALLDSQGVLRTGDSRWWANLQRTPEIRVRYEGQDHPFAVEFVDDFAERARIDEAFLDKYGGWERMMFPQERGKTHDNYARLTAIAAH